MSRRGRRMGSDATVVQKSSQTTSSDAAKSMPEKSMISKSVITPTAVSPTESEIAAAAYRLWLAHGCPVGSGEEDWFRAEAMLKSALITKWKDLSGPPSIPRCDTRTKSDMLAEFRWEGHWEVWESEWGGPRWVWDLATPSV